ncbi:MAG: hypothetical protein LAO21_06215 [Acidobacteriia bacterium]|nr:hypothetical protein [Terriglobia bacterium]
MHAARDLKTFIASREPPPGPGLGLIIALDQNGKELWMKVSSLPEAAISHAGDKIASWVNDNQDPSEEDGYHPDEQEGEFQILSRQGEVLKTLAIEGRPIAFSSDGHSLLILKPPDLSLFDLEGNPLWHIPASDRSGVITGGDLRVVLLYDRGGQGLSWFEPNH